MSWDAHRSVTPPKDPPADTNVGGGDIRPMPSPYPPVPSAEYVDRYDIAVVRKALEMMPGQCRYHGARLDYEGPRTILAPQECCDTGKPARARREALAALDRIRDAR